MSSPCITKVRINPDDVDALPFLCFPNNDPSKEPIDYQMPDHPFGGIWSASCANYALLHTATVNTDKFDVQVVKTVEKQFYVESEDKAIDLAQDLSSLLAQQESRKVIIYIPLIERAKEIKDMDLGK